MRTFWLWMHAFLIAMLIYSGLGNPASVGGLWALAFALNATGFIMWWRKP